MTRRKTIEVARVLELANTYLANSKPHDKFAEMRQGVASLLESVLHETGNYRGFNYLDSPYKAGETDDSRRYYHGR